MSKKAIGLLKEIRSVFDQPATHHGGMTCIIGKSFMREYGDKMDKAIALLEFEPEPTVGADRLREIAEKTWTESNAAKRHLLNMADEFDRLTAENKRLKGEKPIPFAWWKDCPDLAQKVMERIMDTNNELQASLKLSEQENEHLELRIKELEIIHDKEKQ